MKLEEELEKLIQEERFYGILLFLAISLFFVFYFYAKANLSISLIMIPIALGVWIVGLLVTLVIGKFLLEEGEK